MTLERLRRYGAAKLRSRFRRPLYPPRAGIGVLPWVAGPGMHTRYFLNAMRDPALDRSETEIDITRFDEQGAVVAKTTHRLGRASITVVDLPETGTEHCGYCWITGAERAGMIALQFHFQVMARHSFAKTHGRAKGIPTFGRADAIDRTIRLLDPYPYSASSALTRDRGVRQGFLFLNLSDRPCRIVRAKDGRKAADLRPHGARLAFDATPDAPTVDFSGSSPFTFYVAMSRPDGGGLTFQHIKDTF